MMGMGIELGFQENQAAVKSLAGWACPASVIISDAGIHFS
jgi:hypothetical protein